MEIRVLGPLEAQVAGCPADLGGPRQRAVLALLLVARGDLVSVDRLIDDLWSGEPPPRATGALQTYVSHLRRALEPDRQPRTPARVLVSVAPGYALRLPAESVDAWRFEDLLRRAAEFGPGRERRVLLEDALAMWRGPAYAEFAGESWAMPEIVRLEELRLVARERLAEARIATGAAAEAVLDADALTREYPLREEAWRLLALALAACGRQGEALAALRRARRVLADELGLDPGPTLVELEAALLAQDANLLRSLSRPVVSAPPSSPAASSLFPPPPAPDAPTQPAAGEADDGFVGRQAALEGLGAAAAAAVPGVPSLALVSGEAGSGKSALLDRFRGSLMAAGWRVVLGRCPEAEGAPPAWAWTQALRDLASIADPGPLADAVAPLLADSVDAGSAATGPRQALAARFRLHQAVVRWLASVPSGPVAVLLDDLHRADVETLALLRSLLELWPASGTPLLLVAAHRSGEARAEFADTLEALARGSPTRIELAGLSMGEASRLIAGICGWEPDGETVEVLARRTG